MKLSNALTILATSPVSKDREAIARLEKTAQRSIQEIMGELENQSTLAEFGLHNLLEEKRKATTKMIVSAGLFCSGLSCLITIWLRPGLAFAITPIGFITGAAASSLVLANESRNLAKSDSSNNNLLD
ncbi:hypothetical protein COO91_01916 [Nostoc flagelliforme CCNUN1]|uniref:DUF2335 domain-containing protein n=1 Tax=Nostoc flagelliforme CCNUN1 TaxID=2038116 RepID=A0A2K8SKS5_9NOSO|nr:hypothetical protein [Nostoc flagelliforme]AUB36017.1 hypothetical protein COO91_01916 [Nostoc flagelliforme CCNUN1]